MNSLAVDYMGLELRSPLVASASPLTMNLDQLRQLEDAGAGAVVLGSLFAEVIQHEAAALAAHGEAGCESHGESFRCLPEPAGYPLGPHEYLEHVRRASESLDIPVIASLNAGTIGSWAVYAAFLERAGADGIELNLYSVAADPQWSGAQIERDQVHIVEAVRAATDLPLAVKIGPYYSSMAAMARAFADAGADALVLFNRFYQPDIDLEQLEVVPDLELSRPFDGRLAMRWIALLFGRVELCLGATTGIHSAADALKMIAAGADVTMLCSALLQRGIPFLAEVETGMRAWLDEHGYACLDELRGVMSHRTSADPAAFERGNYVKALFRYR